VGGSAALVMPPMHSVHAGQFGHGQLSGWLTPPAMPYPVFGHMVTTYGGRLYVIGGYDHVAGTARTYVKLCCPVRPAATLRQRMDIDDDVAHQHVRGVALAVNGELFALAHFNFPLGSPTGKRTRGLGRYRDGEIMTDVVIPDGWFESPAMDLPGLSTGRPGPITGTSNGVGGNKRRV